MPGTVPGAGETKVERLSYLESNGGNAHIGRVLSYNMTVAVTEVSAKHYGNTAA